MIKKDNRIFGKSIKEILFETIEGKIYPRIGAEYDKLPERERGKLRDLPHLYRDGYRGSMIKEISEKDVNKEILETWKKYGFTSKEKFEAVFEYYDALTKINLIFNILPVEAEEETEEEAYDLVEPYTEEGYEYLQQLDDWETEEEDW